MEQWGADRKHRGSEEERKTKEFCFVFPSVGLERSNLSWLNAVNEVDRMWLFYPPYLLKFRFPGRFA